MGQTKRKQRQNEKIGKRQGERETGRTRQRGRDKKRKGREGRERGKITTGNSKRGDADGVRQ